MPVPTYYSKIRKMLINIHPITFVVVGNHRLQNQKANLHMYL